MASAVAPAVAMMSMHRLSAGSGYQYLLRHTASGDVQRLAGAELSDYYTASGYPPGRWLGAGLAGLNADLLLAHGVEAPARTGAPPSPSVSNADAERRANGLGDGPWVVGGAVTEEAMARLYGHGEHPGTGAPLGARYLVYRPVEQRIAEKVARLPADLSEGERARVTADIHTRERARPSPSAVAGFDLTFTMAKSASVLWALATPAVQARIATAHRDTVAEVMGVLERDALFTRTGHGGIAQVTTRGAIATCFDHWDTRAGDPNLHTHVVLANKVQGEDGRWRSVDSRALHHAAVALSELYDDLLADRLTRDLGVGWEWRWRGPRRTPGFEITGVGDPLLAEFSARSKRIEVATRDLVADYRDRHGHAPDRAQVLRIRQQATLSTRPEKTLRPLPELFTDWRRRAALHGPLAQLLTTILPGGTGVRPVALGEVGHDQVEQLAGQTLGGLQDRRVIWNRWNVRAEAARATRGLRLADPTDRIQLIEQITTRVLDGLCVALDPPALFLVPAQWQRPDGTSVFDRSHETAHTSPALLAAETRLLAAAADTTGPRAPTLEANPTRPDSLPREGHAQVGRLHEDQASAVATVLSSGRRVDLLIGPAGAGKTRTLRAVRAAWEATYGPASVVGLAPSATAAAELGTAVGIACDTLAKWQHENTRADTGSTTVPASKRGRRATPAGVMWTLRAGQLVVVDEASLAGTLDLDRLAAQAGRAGVKLLLVGDHHQLGAVDAGGAFGLLARDTGAAELSLLWRFTNRWEAVASRALRQGDASALASYDAHGRLHEGPAEAMVEDAYRAWREAVGTGQQAVLVAADNPTVAALNARAQTDLHTSGGNRRPTDPGGNTVSAAEVTGSDAGRSVGLHDDTRVWAGDRIVTRCNDRRLASSGGGWVRNGDLWTITATRPDGSLDAVRWQPQSHSKQATPGRPGEDRRGTVPDRVRFPAAYVGEHVELGYATTVHRAQGITADAAFTLIGPGMSRESLYVAMTRGRSDNHAYVATDLPDPDHPHPHPGSPERTGRQVLQGILVRSDAHVSATETLRTRYDLAASLATLVPIHQTLIQASNHDRYTELLRTAGLDDTTVATITASPTCSGLMGALHRGEQAGHDPADVIRNVVPDLPALRPNDGAVVDDPAATLRDRVVAWLEDTPPEAADGPRLVAGLVPAAGPVHDPDLARTLADIETLITARTRALATTTLHHPPPWAVPLGPPPRAAAARRTWLDALATVAGYRDLHHIDGGQPLGPTGNQTDHFDPESYRHASQAVVTATQLARQQSSVLDRGLDPTTAERALHR